MPATTLLEQANAELTLRLHQQSLGAALANFSLQSDALPPVLHRACIVAAEGVGCRFAKVLEFLPERNCLLMRAGIGWQPGTVGHACLPADLGSPAGYALQTGEPVLSNDLAGERRFRIPALLREHGIDCAFNVLIQTPDGPYGVLEVDSVEDRAFSAADTAFLQGLAATLSHAITKLRRLEALQRSQRFVEGLLSASPNCVKIVDAAGLLSRVNPNGVCLLGFESPEQLVGRPWTDLWPEDQRPLVHAGLAQARAGQTARFDALAPVRGVPRWWEVQVTPLDGSDDVLAVSHDITERVAATQAKDLLMLEVHHRVKNSLQLVQNLLSLQSRASDNEQAAEQLMESAARVRTIAAIHDRLYTTGSALTLDVAPYLDGLVADLSDGMASTLDGRDIVIEADDVAWPAGELPALGLVLTELVTNALKYGAGTIRVNFRQPADGRAVLTVADDGTGLPEGFNPTQSRGLGMRLINGLLRGDGAGLAIERQPTGTAFVARLPATRRFAP